MWSRDEELRKLREENARLRREILSLSGSKLKVLRLRMKQLQRGQTFVQDMRRLVSEIQAREAQKQAALKALQSERRDDWCIGSAVDILIRDA